MRIVVRWLAGALRGAVRELVSLVVDDGLLAATALGAVAVAFLLSRDALLGGADAVGWLLSTCLAGGVFVAVRRAIAASADRDDRSPDGTRRRRVR